MGSEAQMERLSLASGANLAYIDDLYHQYLNDENSVDEGWRNFFRGYELGLSRLGEAGEGSVEAGGKGHLDAKVEAFINLYRRLGHLSAALDPLSPAPSIREDLQPATHGLGQVEASQLFQPVNLPGGEQSFESIFRLLKDTYCGHIGADFRDLNSIEEVVWLQEQMEKCRNQPNFDASKQSRILDCLIRAEGFERFLQDRYLGQKRFSVEGLESLIPLLDTIAQEAAQGSVDEICIGMAHRGRLNVLANFMQKPYLNMLHEFEGSDYNTFDIDGDVKYHMGFANTIKEKDGEIRVYLSPNPSHLEAVNPIVEGFCRARQRLVCQGKKEKIVPVLIHGDAAFVGQGIVTETLNLSGLESYGTGGTIHIITNNQVGFTTDPEESRSCDYSSDVAKVIRAPVFHVNADDPEAVAWTGMLAFSYRQKFGKDVVIDLIGYRKHGHNESDEPSYTQPQMYKKIKKHPSVLKQYGDKLVVDGVVTKEHLDDSMRGFRASLQKTLDDLRAGVEIPESSVPQALEISTTLVKASENDFFKPVVTKVDRATLETLGTALFQLPENFTPHPKLRKLFDNRLKMFDGDGRFDWAVAELMAYASIVSEGKHVRVSGQDCQRGTFSHRQASLKDYENGRAFHILNRNGWAESEIINSPLSEQGVLGFEFGYSVADRNALVIWEAQFGDFANGAQIIIDQFLAASEAKWRQACSLVLLLPHGYEGMGPEHSSARPERFLQLCGSLNMQVVNLTTPAQLFHVMRRQVIRDFKKPLVVMSPKSLLRHPEVVSSYDAFSDEGFSETLDDTEVTDKLEINRIVLCTGKVFFELKKVREENKANRSLVNTALVRVEQLYPFPTHQVEALLDSYPNLQEVLWTQEEPSNMGYWTFVRHRIKKLAASRSLGFRFCGRKSAGTTAEGSHKAHSAEQHRILQDSLGLACSVMTDGERDS